jgi:Secretion system C-terminal sorting domain
MKSIVTFILVPLLFFVEFLFAQPVNDDCSGATVVTQTANCSPTPGTTVNATQSAPAIYCNGLEGYADDDVWYVFTATTHSPTITVIPAAGFDAVVDLRSGSCDGTTIYCSDAKGPGGSETIWTYGLLIDEYYYIRIYSFGLGSSTQGNFTVCVYGTLPPPPSNDDCPGAMGIGEGPFCSPQSGTTASATQSVAPILCDGSTGYSDDDVWYKFIPYTSNPTITVAGTPLFDAVVDLREGPCDGTTIFCADATGAGGTESIKAAGLTIGDNYLIRVYSYGSDPNSQEEFTICVYETVCLNCPDYDFTFSPGLDWQIHSSTTGSLGCNIYQFNITAGNEYTFKTGCGDGASADFDTYLELSDFNCNSIAGDDNNCEENRSKIVWEATFNGYAYLNIHGSNPDAYGSYSLAYEISDPVSLPEPFEDKTLQDLINIYPNPASAAFQIESRQLVSLTKVVVYDYTGRVIRSFCMNAPVKSFFSDNLQLAPGLYILAIESNKGWVYKRLEAVR